jgi:hypothetical protein
VPGAYQAAEGVADHPGRDERGDLGVVVGRGALHDLDARQRAGSDELDELQDLAGQKAAGLWLTRAGDERGIQAVHVEGQPDGVGTAPGNV